MVQVPSPVEVPVSVVSTGSTDLLEQLTIAAKPNAENPLFKNSLRSICFRVQGVFTYLIETDGFLVAKMTEFTGKQDFCIGEWENVSVIFPLFYKAQIGVTDRNFFTGF